MKKEKNEMNGNEHKSNEIKIEGQAKKTTAKEQDYSAEIKKLEDELTAANEKIQTLLQEIEDYKDKLLRKAAEFENYKRRTENDQINLLKYDGQSFIVKLLTTIDDFERSLQHIDNAKDNGAIKEGIKLVYDKMMKALSEQGVTKILSVGKPFDVHYHEALLQRPAENVAPHTVLDEVETGYMYKDRVIRHAKVVVSEDSGQESIKPSGTDNDNNNNNSEDM